MAYIFCFVAVVNKFHIDRLANDTTKHYKTTQAMRTQCYYQSDFVLPDSWCLTPVNRQSSFIGFSSFSGAVCMLGA